MRSLDFGTHMSLETTDTRSESPSRARARNRVASLKEQTTREVTVVAVLGDDDDDDDGKCCREGWLVAFEDVSASCVFL
jgi:hypothetical protein